MLCQVVRETKIADHRLLPGQMVAILNEDRARELVAQGIVSVCQPLTEEEKQALKQWRSNRARRRK